MIYMTITITRRFDEHDVFVVGLRGESGWTDARAPTTAGGRSRGEGNSAERRLYYKVHLY